MKSKHVIDLRAQPKPRPQPAPPPLELPPAPPRPKPPEPAPRHRVVNDVMRWGLHPDPEPRSPHLGALRPQGETTEQADAGSDTGSREERDSVQPREGVSTGGHKPRKWPRLVGRIVRGVLVAIAAVIFLSINIPLPERLIGIYFVASLVYAIDSQRTFIVALIFLLMVAISSAVNQSVPAENYAVYAFYFLVIGLIAAIREQALNRSGSDRDNSQLSD